MRLIHAYLFPRKLSELYMWMDFHSLTEHNKIFMMLLGHFKMMDQSLIGDFQNKEVFLNF